MPKIATQTSDFDFTVKQVPLFDEQGRRSGFFGNQRSDTGGILGVTSDRYGIVQHGSLIEAAEEGFENAGLGAFERNVYVTGDGARMRAHYDFKSQTRALRREDRQVGDEMGLRLTLQNSFDRSLRVSFALGMLRLVCTNGMTTLESEVSMTKKHSANVETNFLEDAIKKAVGNWDTAIKKVESLTQRTIEHEQGLTILSNLVRMGALSDRMSGEIAKVWNDPSHDEDKGRNLYNLYNATTQHLTHNVESTRAELADRTSRNVFKRLWDATHKEADMAKLLLPLKTVEVENN
jgi:hypothetical protein|tara:strand:- start:2314 stop:3189 length:876 start_codon:yes stop_codon:yes gene_type:complete